MKKYLSPFLLWILAACSGPGAQPVLSDKARTDTLQVGNKVYRIKELADTNYAFKAPIKIDTSDATALAKEKDFVQREGDTLFFKCDNGRVMQLVDNKSEGDDYYSFYFVGYEKEINSYIVFAGLYEGSYYVLVNKSNGERINTIAYPQTSPNGRYMAAANFDLMASYSINGIELFEKTGSGYRSLGMRELLNWGPQDVLWKNDTTLIIKAQLADTSGYNFKTAYRALYIH